MKKIILQLFLHTTALSTVFSTPLLEREEPADQKILFVSIPKSGTHLLKKALRKITHYLPIRWIGLSKVALFNPVNDLRQAAPITATHLFPEIDIVRTHYSNQYKKILIIRDPRDVMVSFMHHLLTKKAWIRRSGFDYEKFALLSADEQLATTLLFPDEFRNPKTCFKYAALWMQDPSVLVCRFEDLVGEKGGGSAEKQLETLQKLATYLGYPLSDQELHSLAAQLFGGTWTFRQGKIGTWKTFYNEENKRLFKQLMGQSVIDLGYAVDDTW